MAKPFKGGAKPFKGWSADWPPQTAPAGLRSLRLANFDFSKNKFLSNVKLWEIVFMGFLTHRNLPETLGGSYTKNENFEMFDVFLHGQIFHFFHNSWFAITAIRASP